MDQVSEVDVQLANSSPVDAVRMMSDLYKHVGGLMLIARIDRWMKGQIWTEAESGVKEFCSDQECIKVQSVSPTDVMEMECRMTGLQAKYGDWTAGRDDQLRKLHSSRRASNRVDEIAHT